MKVLALLENFFWFQRAKHHDYPRTFREHNAVVADIIQFLRLLCAHIIRMEIESYNCGGKPSDLH